MLCSLTLSAQDIKSLFIELPDSLSPLLTKVNREDFGDFLASNMKAEVRNRFGKTSEMITMTDDYLMLKVSSVSTAEMKLLPVNDSVKVICVVRTYTAPAADSQIEFYDTSWQELPLSDFLTLLGRRYVLQAPPISRSSRLVEKFAGIGRHVSVEGRTLERRTRIDIYLYYPPTIWMKKRQANCVHTLWSLPCATSGKTENSSPLCKPGWK